jgi:glycine dehydrogenase subunit 1
MGSYVPNTKEEQQEMLRSIGMKSFDELFANIPNKVKLNRPLAIDSGRSESEVLAIMEQIAEKNLRFKHVFRGAGAYRHFIPSIVKHVTSKEEFVTSYTPYQPEISQGVLQSIFEFQTMICDLTGMDAANASVYDGATAAAEAAAMCRDKKRKTAYASATADPKTLAVIKTTCFASGTDLVVVPEKNGRTDIAALGALLGDDAACFYLQQPNFYGIIEDAKAIGEVAHSKGARFIMGVYPFSLALLATPAECGADIAVGDGQPLGIPLSFGGPTLGFMATNTELLRKLPGRIAGETVDSNGKRAYVLTLQAREQHIRREKASSNICSNQALCAMTATAYLAAVGPKGFHEAALQCVSKAHYLAEALAGIGFVRKHDGEFFNEFVTVCDTPATDVLNALETQGFLGGYPLADNEILWCATEMNTKAEMDALASILKGVCKP